MEGKGEEVNSRQLPVNDAKANRKAAIGLHGATARTNVASPQGSSGWLPVKT